MSVIEKRVRIFLVKFKNEISFNEIPQYRGPVINSMKGEAEILYHNHKGGDEYRYSYPLIQYKRIHKKAAIFSIGEGVEAIGQFLSCQNFNLKLANRQLQLEIESVSPKTYVVQVWDSEFKYRIRNWLPLNTENYKKYIQLEAISDKVIFLEKILIGNILSFAKGIGIDIQNEISCKMITISEPKPIKAIDVKMMAFDAEFKTNISLPDYMGLGKHASLGFGTVVREYNK